MGWKELWAKVWPLVMILGVTIYGWHLLTDLASRSRLTSTTEDYNQAMTWAHSSFHPIGTSFSTRIHGFDRCIKSPAAGLTDSR